SPAHQPEFLRTCVHRARCLSAPERRGRYFFFAAATSLLFANSFSFTSTGQATITGPPEASVVMTFMTKWASAWALPLTPDPFRESKANVSSSPLGRRLPPTRWPLAYSGVKPGSPCPNERTGPHTSLLHE